MNILNYNLKNFNLSEKAFELLEHVIENQNEGFNDPRGCYCEFDTFQCKPWDASEVSILVESNLVTLHKDSDHVPLNYNEVIEPAGGVAFLAINIPFLTSIKLKNF
jgi:hypothetical protein